MVKICCIGQIPGTLIESLEQNFGYRFVSISEIKTTDLIMVGHDGTLATKTAIQLCREGGSRQPILVIGVDNELEEIEFLTSEEVDRCLPGGASASLVAANIKAFLRRYDSSHPPEYS